MVNVWCVRAVNGVYTNDFVSEGFIGLGLMPLTNLSLVKSREELDPIYQKEYPNQKSLPVIGQQVGQVARFLHEIKAGDYVVTPSSNTELLHYGRISLEPSYFYFSGNSNCPYKHRRKIEWEKETLNRNQFSIPFQNTIRSSLTVFAISQKDEFLSVIGNSSLSSKNEKIIYDNYKVVLEQILELDAKEFEILVGYLLTALGFEGSEVTGKVGDGGVDAVGVLNASNLAKVKVFIQAKRYKIGTKIDASTLRQLRQAIPMGGQGAFITTADFQSSANEIALEQGFPRIGLINGKQLVDLLIANWNFIPSDFQERLGLKIGLVKI